MVKRLGYSKSILNSILIKEPNYQPAKNLMNSERFLKSESQTPAEGTLMKNPLYAFGSNLVGTDY